MTEPLLKKPKVNKFMGQHIDQKVKIRVKRNSCTRIIPINEILYIKANSPYAQMYLEDGSNIFCSESIKYFDNKLSHYNFYRIHRSYLVNIESIKSVCNEGDGMVQINDGSKIKMARGKKNIVLTLLDDKYL